MENNFLMNTARHLVEKVIPSNLEGFTLDIRTRRLMSFGTDKFIVSLGKHEGKFETPLTLGHVYDWLSGNHKILYQKGHYVGGWYYEGFYYLDVSVLVNGIGNAIDLGLRQNQIGIYYPYEGKTIFLEEYKKEIAA